MIFLSFSGITNRELAWCDTATNTLRSHINICETIRHDAPRNVYSLGLLKDTAMDTRIMLKIVKNRNEKSLEEAELELSIQKELEQEEWERYKIR
jgi:hypothetical protein